MQQWQPNFCSFSNIFSDIRQILLNQHWDTWPNCEQLNDLLPIEVTNQQGQSLRLVEQTPALLSDGLYYEQRIYQQGLVPTRYGNWHDFFNALIYLMFPKTKQEINRLHSHHIEQFGDKKRSKCRDALTLLDECGVLIPYANEVVATQLQTHQWQAAFVDARDCWGNDIDAVMIGHANYEKALNPYIGFTGKALYLKVEQKYFSLPLFEKYQYLDRILSECLEQKTQDNRQLFPLPILGVPGWFEDNLNPEFYHNTEYF